MKNKKTLGLIAGIILVIIVCIFAFGRKKETQESVAVDAAKVQKETIVKQLATSGTLIANDTQDIYGTGIAHEVKVSVGDAVKKDDVLVTYTSGLELKANLDGTITALNVKAEENDISSQQGLPSVTIADLTTLKVAIGLSKSEAAEVKVDQPVEITSGTQTFPGKVNEINPVAATSQSMAASGATLPAVLTFDTPPNGLFAGFDVDCKITVATAENVISLPIEALLYDKDNQPFVFVIKDGVAKKVVLTLGIQSDTAVEVTSGLAENDQVVLSPDQNLQGKNVTVN